LAGLLTARRQSIAALRVPHPREGILARRAAVQALALRLSAAWARQRDGRARAPAIARLSPAPVQALLRQKRTLLEGLSARLESASYQSVLARGFALVRDAEGHAVTAAARIAPGQPLRLAFADGEARVVAEGMAPRRKGQAPGQGSLL
uniref:exodeoxyribonuclease VII large subunit n=1 Tax=Roseomonas rosulenta TaxID=2748667 RepID=UPI00272CACDF